MDEFYEHVWRQGVERGLDPEEATEVALNAVEEQRALPQSIDLRTALGMAAGSGYVDRALQLKEDVRRILEAVIQQRPGWTIRSEHIPVPGYGRLDFAVETDQGLILVETQLGMAGNSNILKRMAYERTVDQIQPYRAFLVVPDDVEERVGEGRVSGGEGGTVTTVRVSDLTAALLAL